MNRNVISVLDGAIGSCGKGKVVGEIATDPNIVLGASVSNCKPNAGHTFVSEKGEKMVFTNIPVSAVNPNTELFIGPGAAIDMPSFIKEYERHAHLLGDRKIYVHEMVSLIEDRHKEREKAELETGSTYKGCGAVVAEKAMRNKNLQFFKGYKNAVVVSIDEYLDRLGKHLENEDEYVMLESSQGCGLDSNYSKNYPNTTSEDISTAYLLDKSGISAERLLQTIMVIRPFPIRISNITNDGKIIYTGGFGSGAPLTWTQINLSAALGTYPYPGDIELYYYKLTLRMIRKLLTKSNDIAIKQVFGKDICSIDSQTVTLLEALELERLINKAQGNEYYASDILTGNFSNLKDSMVIRDLSEQTTVTKMERRIGDLDIKQLKNYCRINTPYGLYLNFFQHLNLDYEHEVGNFENYYFDRYLENYLDWLESETRTQILALGTGAKNGEKILKKELIRR